MGGDGSLRIRNEGNGKTEGFFIFLPSEKVTELAVQLEKLQVEVRGAKKGEQKGSTQVAEQEHRSFQRRKEGKKLNWRTLSSEKV